MTKIKKITVSNLKAVSALTADFNGCTAIITGKNNSGKTSFLRALADRMRGIKSDLVVKKGEREGFYEMELTSGEKFIWEFKTGKEKLTWVTEENIKTSVTKEISSYYFPKVFDVDRFLTDTPKEQRATLEKIAGIDFTDINRNYAGAFEERTFANRKLKEEEARLIQFETHWKKDRTDTRQLELDIAGIGEHNLRFKTVITQIQEKRKDLEGTIIEITELESKLVAAKTKQVELQTKIDKGVLWAAEEKNKPKLNGVELNEKLVDIMQNNTAVDRQQAYDKAVKNSAEAEKAVQKVQQDKIDALKSSSLPEGFEFTDDGIMYNGFPFNRQQLSSSGVYIGALKLAALGLGEVKTLHFDASYLDKNSLAEIEKWAAENNLQLLIERPDFEGGEISYEIVQNDSN